MLIWICGESVTGACFLMWCGVFYFIVVCSLELNIHLAGHNFYVSLRSLWGSLCLERRVGASCVVV